jgi:4-amino-4-deoxy-L-arabinose transferase-like glycosyltransferase
MIFTANSCYGTGQDLAIKLQVGKNFIIGSNNMRFRKNYWFLLLLTVLTIFMNLGSMPLLDPDEPVYAETPKEMIQLNDFISPRIYGEYWYDKPPMYYWLVAGAFKLFGINEFGARFPSALLAVICVTVVYLSTAKLFSESAGIASGLVLATSIEYFYLGKAAVTDITLTLFLTASLLCFLQRQYYLFYVFSALATLTKGPIGLLFPGAIIFIWMILVHRFRELKYMKIPAGILIFAVVALPWYWIMYQIHGAAFVDGFIGVNNITRFTTAEHAKTSGWYFFIPVLILGFFPWISLLFQAIKTSLKSKETDEYATLVFLNIWAAFIFIFFSISSTKLVTYILPSFPPLAILVGWYLERCGKDYRLVGMGLIWPWLLTILSVLLVGGMVVGCKMMPVIIPAASGLAIVLILMTISVWYFLSRKHVLKAVWGQAIFMALASIIIVTILVPPIAENLSTRGIAQSFTTYYDAKSPVYVTKFLHPGFAYYTNTYGKEINSAEEISRVISEDGQAYLAIRQPEYEGLSNVEKGALTILARSDNKVLLLKR